MIIDKRKKIFVAGHRGLVGSAVVKTLESQSYTHILKKTRQELDLRDKKLVFDFFKQEEPAYVILAAAKVGGIGANAMNPTEFLLENLEIQNNVISAAAEFGVEKLIFLGSSCIYPKEAKYPLTEDQLLQGPFEKTNEGYALAKVVGLKLCEYYHRQYGKSFISVMPTSLYGPGDYYDFDKAHVLPAMFLKVLRAKKNNEKSVTFWGSGKPLREFLYSEDLASAIIFCLEKYNEPTFINVGSGEEIPIKELAALICKTCEFEGEQIWDETKPDGTFRKNLDSSKIRELGWKPNISLEEGFNRILPEAEAALERLS